jgi:16S rRNA (cytosine967-C5)-methyltransferase
MMRNTGRLYAMDTSAHRLDGLKPRAQKSGIHEVHTMVLAHEQDQRLARMAAKVDRVLVDAPCSGLGTLRRNPDLQWRLSLQDLEALQALQLSIVQSAAKLVKPGGRLVYATCSLLTQENEAVAQAFEHNQRDWVKLDAAEVLQAAGVEAAPSLCRQGYLRLWPHRHHTDGFFAAVWQRKA